jgi:cleavage and polyadenylation specificity factor subunit 3
MWLVDIDGVRVLYTGDFSLEDERHLKGAEIPPISPDVLIPIFALGRVQELLLILEEYWANHPNLQHIPIHYGSNLAKKSMAVYTNFRAGMSDAPVIGRSRFDFKYIHYLKMAEELDDSLPCVVLAAPAMLQNGMSRQIFERWAPNPLNGIIIPGYTVENTLAKQLFTEPKEIECLQTKQFIPRKISIYTVSFSGHSDWPHTLQFVEALKTKRVVLVHGVALEMDRLRERLAKELASSGIEVYAPGDCEGVNFEFKSNPTAMVNGNLHEALNDGREHLSGLIIRKDFAHMIVSPAELSSYSTLRTLGVSMKQQIQMTRPLLDFVDYLARHFAGVSVVEGGIVMVGTILKIEQKADDLVTIEWRSDPMSDMVADNVAMMLSCINPVAFDTDVTDLFARRLELALQCRWGCQIQFDPEFQQFQFQLDGEDVFIAIDPDSSDGITIEGRNPEIAGAIRKLAAKLYEMAQPMILPSSV